MRKDKFLKCEICDSTNSDGKVSVFCSKYCRGLFRTLQNIEHAREFIENKSALENCENKFLLNK